MHRRPPLPILVYCLLTAASFPACAQHDPGRALEREYGVVAPDTDERSRMIERLNRVVARMSAALAFKPRSAKILGGKDPRWDKEINALALPDGRIYVMAGLMTAAQKTSHPDASLAFVVGHELTHVIRHHSRSQMKGDVLGAVGGALLARALGGGYYAERTASDIGSGLIGGHYSRQHEYEADRGGLIGLSKAGYPLEGAAEMMQVLLDRYGVDKSVGAAWFDSHPNTRNRVLRLQSMADEIKAGRLPDERESNRPKEPVPKETNGTGK